MPSIQTMDQLSKAHFVTKFIAGKFYVEVNCRRVSDRIFMGFRYNAELLADVKRSFEDRRYEPNTKEWSFPITDRNIFQFEALQGKYGPNPYLQWRNPIPDSIYSLIDLWAVQRGLSPMAHQREIMAQMLFRRHFLCAAEMGLGKTLCAMIVSEIFLKTYPGTLLWASGKGALVSARLEFSKWRSPLNPLFMTYDGVRTSLKKWDGDAPRVFIMDESSYLKNRVAQRSKACAYIASSMRKEHGAACLIIGMTGTPAPKSPIDWWSQCEIMAPGYITEAHPLGLQDRLAIVDTVDEGGVPYKKVVAWKDGSDICGQCGKESQLHVTHPWDYDHTPVKTTNEVKSFGERLKGLVGVWYKKDCLDLPNKWYQVMKAEATKEIKDIARSLLRTTSRGSDLLVKLRTLSDGFLYDEVPTSNMITCGWCVEGKVQIALDENEQPIYDTCNMCKGAGIYPELIRISREVPCPKLDMLFDIMEEHEEGGRLNVYAGFTGSIDRIRREVLEKGWEVIKADGHGWTYSGDTSLSREQMILLYQSDYDGKIMFLGQPGAAGMGLTLTAAPTTVFYSNDFNPQSRFQAEDRGHRPSMDVVKGGRIIDLVHLESDEKVLNSLLKSRNLQAIPMDEIQEWFND